MAASSRNQTQKKVRNFLTITPRTRISKRKTQELENAATLEQIGRRTAGTQGSTLLGKGVSRIIILDIIINIYICVQ